MLLLQRECFSIPSNSLFRKIPGLRQQKAAFVPGGANFRSVDLEHQRPLHSVFTASQETQEDEEKVEERKLTRMKPLRISMSLLGQHAPSLLPFADAASALFHQTGTSPPPFSSLIAQAEEEIREQEVPEKPSAGESVSKTLFQVFTLKCLTSFFPNFLYFCRRCLPP